MSRRRLRDRAAILVIIAAALTTVATSPPFFLLEDEAVIELTATDIRTFHIVLTPEAVEETLWSSITVSATGELDRYEQLLVAPADERLDSVDLAELAREPTPGAEARHRYHIDASELCPPAQLCELAFTLEAEGEGEIQLGIRAALEREQSDFSDAARVEILVDE